MKKPLDPATPLRSPAPWQDFQKFLDEQRADYQRALPEKRRRSMHCGVLSGLTLTPAQRPDIALAIAALQASLPID